MRSMGQKCPKISVIVPVYNVEPYLERCLGSIAAQTYPNMEAILVDDASTDGGEKICQDWAARDGRFQYVRMPANRGPSAARNAGVARASGDFAVFIDSDDYVESELLVELYRSHLETGAEISVCGDEGMGLREGPAAVYSREETVQCLAQRTSFLWTVWGKLYPMSLVKETPFSEEALCCEDLLFFYQLLKRVERVSYIPRRLYHYVYREGSLINSGVNKKRCTVLSVLDDICSDAPAWFSHETVCCWKLLALDTGVRLAMQAVEDGTDGPLWEYLERFRDYTRRHFSRRALALCREKRTAVAVLALRANEAVFWAAATVYGQIKGLKPGVE